MWAVRKKRKKSEKKGKCKGEKVQREEKYKTFHLHIDIHIIIRKPWKKLRKFENK